MIRPSYFGGKNGPGVYQTIINHMPPHVVYIEPFAGGGAVLRMKRPARLNIALDLDQRALASLETAIGDPTSSETAILPAASSEPARTGAHRQIRRWDPKYEFRCGDGISFLAAYPFCGNELVYCDPPYMLKTRGTSRYQFDFTDSQHRQLLSTLRNLPCPVMLSGYHTALYVRKLTGWHTIQFQTTNRAGQHTTEWVWMNFSEPVELHDYRYLGRNFRERERIKRKKQRWTERLSKMPILERRALLAAIAATSTSAGDGDARSHLAGNGDDRATADTAMLQEAPR